MYPITLDLNNRPVLIIGAGNVGERKIVSVCEAGAEVTVISEEYSENISQLAENNKIRIIKRAYKQGDCRGFLLVIASTDNQKINKAIYEECLELGIFVNIVDIPEFCSFHVPAVVRRGDLRIAVSTAGNSPALAREIRKQLEENFGEEYSELVRNLGIKRDELKKKYAGNKAELSKRINEMFVKEYNVFLQRNNSGKAEI
ncbi:bifunctional precorrin-2 dehydrogenase/sirohydrochlorin ferrochelatase [candidate division KSB1 bacterium]